MNFCNGRRRGVIRSLWFARAPAAGHVCSSHRKRARGRRNLETCSAPVLACWPSWQAQSSFFLRDCPRRSKQLDLCVRGGSSGRSNRQFGVCCVRKLWVAAIACSFQCWQLEWARGRADHRRLDPELCNATLDWEPLVDALGFGEEGSSRASGPLSSAFRRTARRIQLHSHQRTSAYP